MGTSSSIFGAGQATSAPSNDPYANIDIDLTKVKQAVKPGKPFEQKTEEEKAKDAEQKTNPSVKSNLRQNSNVKDEDEKNKKSVKFGKSTTYQIDKKEIGDNGSYNNEGTKETGSPRPSKKIIGEKDLSDGRDEKEKIKE